MPSLRLLAALGAVLLLLPADASGHCDTLDGPVVSATRSALRSGSLTAVLRWVPAEAEAEVAAAFASARQVRALSPAAQDLADRWFFETVVRLHRSGEGEPFTGIAPPGTAIDPAVAAVDEALRSGAPDRLLQVLDATLEAGIRQRFGRLLEAKRQDDESVLRGRELVAAYVDLAHYAESLLALASETKGTHEEPRPQAHRPPERSRQP